MELFERVGKEAREEKGEIGIWFSFQASFHSFTALRWGWGGQAIISS